jgi:hypothetical protein
MAPRAAPIRFVLQRGRSSDGEGHDWGPQRAQIRPDRRQPATTDRRDPPHGQRAGTDSGGLPWNEGRTTGRGGRRFVRLRRTPGVRWPSMPVPSPSCRDAYQNVAGILFVRMPAVKEAREEEGDRGGGGGGARHTSGGRARMTAGSHGSGQAGRVGRPGERPTHRPQGATASVGSDGTALRWSRPRARVMHGVTICKRANPSVASNWGLPRVALERLGERGGECQRRRRQGRTSRVNRTRICLGRNVGGSSDGEAAL